MSRLARLAVALITLGAVLSPAAARQAPRDVLPAREAQRPATAAWAAGMARIEPDRRAPTPRACNQGPDRWTRAEIRCAIRRTFPRDPETALCIAWHESRLDPRAVGRLGERGLLQLHPVHRRWLGARWGRMFDPVENLRAGRDLYRMSGYSWAPWTTAQACA